MVEPVIVSGAVAGGSRVAGFFISPLGKWNLIIASVFFAVLIVVGIFQSVEQRSLYPLLDNTVLRVLSADSSIGREIDLVESSARPIHPSSIVSKEFPIWLMFWLKFWLNIICSIWFVWFFGYFLYECFQLISSTSPLRSILLAITTFAIISIIMGMILYNLMLSGKCLIDDKSKNFNAQISNSIPFHGISKLISHILNKDLFLKVADWSDTGLGRAVTSIPSSNNLLNDSQNVSLNNSRGIV